MLSSAVASSFRSVPCLTLRRNPSSAKAPAKTCAHSSQQSPVRGPEGAFMFPDFFGFDKLFDSLFSEPSFVTMKPNPAISASLREEKEAYVVKAKLPGFAKNDISVKIEKDDVLCISAAKKSGGPKVGEQSISFVRRFQLPHGACTRIREATGVMQNGLLTITIPKAKVVSHSIPIKYDD